MANWVVRCEATQFRYKMRSDEMRWDEMTQMSYINVPKQKSKGVYNICRRN